MIRIFNPLLKCVIPRKRKQNKTEKQLENSRHVLSLIMTNIQCRDCLLIKPVMKAASSFDKHVGSTEDGENRKRLIPSPGYVNSGKGRQTGKGFLSIQDLHFTRMLLICFISFPWDVGRSHDHDHIHVVDLFSMCYPETWEITTDCIVNRRRLESSSKVVLFMLASFVSSSRVLSSKKISQCFHEVLPKCTV